MRVQFYSANIAPEPEHTRFANALRSSDPQYRDLPHCAVTFDHPDIGDRRDSA